MDEFGGVTFKELSESLSALTKKVSISGNPFLKVDELKSVIAMLSNQEFADIVIDLVSSDDFAYWSKSELDRLKNVIDMLAYGLPQEKVKEIVELQLDDLAVNFIMMDRSVNGNENSGT